MHGAKAPCIMSEGIMHLRMLLAFYVFIFLISCSAPARGELLPYVFSDSAPDGEVKLSRLFPPVIAKQSRVVYWLENLPVYITRGAEGVYTDRSNPVMRIQVYQADSIKNAREFLQKEIKRRLMSQAASFAEKEGKHYLLQVESKNGYRWLAASFKEWVFVIGGMDDRYFGYALEAFPFISSGVAGSSD